MVNKSIMSSVFGSLFQTLIPNLAAASVFSGVSSIKRHSLAFRLFSFKTNLVVLCWAVFEHGRGRSFVFGADKVVRAGSCVNAAKKEGQFSNTVPFNHHRTQWSNVVEKGGPCSNTAGQNTIVFI